MSGWKKIIAGTLAAATLAMSAGVAAAQPPPPRGWHGHGPHHGWDRRHHRRCYVTWRHHHRVRVCR